jgi:hypothetical protein
MRSPPKIENRTGLYERLGLRGALLCDSELLDVHLVTLTPSQRGRHDRRLGGAGGVQAASPAHQGGPRGREAAVRRHHDLAVAAGRGRGADQDDGDPAAAPLFKQGLHLRQARSRLQSFGGQQHQQRRQRIVGGRGRDEVLCRESGQRPLPPDELALDPLHHPGQVLLEVHAADPLQAGDETPARDGEDLTQCVRAMVGEQADGHRPGRTLRPWSRQAETAHLANIHDDIATAR